MAKKKVAEAKPKKKASKAKSVPGKLFNDHHRVDEIIQRVGVIAQRLDAIMKTGQNLNFIWAHRSLLDDNSLQYLNKHDKDIQEIWEAARHDHFLNQARVNDAQKKAEEKNDIRGFDNL